ncbi:MAG: hypothetical protein IKL98_05985 [Akkermansia sp.]|nr:hypothetical protein [Akkermansia sp.]
MIIRKLSSIITLASALLSASEAAQRAEYFDEALQKAGEDGVIAYCYGPDWNRRSVMLLNSFWKNAKTEEAAGDAVLVAVPFYENKHSEEAEAARGIQGRMPAPPFDVCPTVMFFDKNGRRYACLQGADYLGTDDACTLGVKNIKETICHLRTQKQLLAQAQQKTGEDKAKLLAQVADLPIQAPGNLLQDIKAADPKDKLGYARRLEFSALMFMYELLETKDGFLAPDFEPDYRKIMQKCEAVLKDEALRTRDRQAAYNLYIGQSQREHIQGNRLKGLIRKVNKLDPATDYGQLSPTLMNLWGNIKHKTTPEERRAEREKKKAKEKEKRDKKRQERHVEVN